MAIEAIYPKRDTSRPDPKAGIHPYILLGLEISHANQVWCTDITYIRLKHGFVYLCAILDWYSRKVLSWELSTTMDKHFCIVALE
jgi:putative transposase